MKKFCKVLLGAASAAAVMGGVCLFLKKVVFKKNSDGEFDDFDDDMDDFEENDGADENREYVSIKITSEEEKPEEEKKAEEPEQKEEKEA